MTQITPQEVMRHLDRIAGELSLRSDQLNDVCKALEPIEQKYDAFVDDYELGLLLKSETTDYKLPSEKLRLKKARAAMDADLLGRYEALLRKRKRLQDRISNLKAEADARRSILSAQKEGLV